MDDKRVSEMRGRADCAYQIPSGGLWAARDVTDLLDALTTAQARIAEMEGVLKWHHDWHLQVGDIGLPDGEGGWIGIDMCDAYSDSLMCEKTTALLAGVPSEVLPRGGVNAHWWQISILQRRRIKELEASRHADRVAGVRGHVIRTSYVNPPIPNRNSDWQAVFDKYDADQFQPVGHGKSELAAIRDLLESLED